MQERQAMIKQNSRIWELMENKQIGRGISGRNAVPVDQRIFKKVLSLVPKTNQTEDIRQVIEGPSKKELLRMKSGKWLASYARD